MKKYNVCRKCKPNHIDNCETCFGFGVRINQNKEYIPISAGAATRQDYELGIIRFCPECGSGPTGYKSSNFYKQRKEKRNKISIVSVAVLALVITLWLQVSADACVSIPPDMEWLEYSRFVAYQIETENQVGKCWVTNRMGFEHFRAFNWIMALDGTAGPITSYPVIVSPVSPIYLPIINK